MSVRGGRARVIGAVAAMVVPFGAGARAQDVEPPPPIAPAQTAPAGDQAQPSVVEPALDPSAPLAPMPDIGVAWPDLSTAPGATSAQSSAVSPESRYAVHLSGVDAVTDPLFRERFDQLSALKVHEKDATNAAQIDRRARQDTKLLTQLLQGEGYYDARVSVEVDQANGRPQVTLTAVTGPLYRFASVDISGLAAAGDKAAALRNAFPIHKDDPVDADTIAAATANLRTAVGQQGFAFAKVSDPEITIDHAAHAATLTLALDTGQALRFGKVVATTGKVFRANHIQAIARFSPGDPYKASLLDDLHRALIQTSLVSQADVKPVPGSTPGTVDIDVALQPAPVHTIAGELGYGTGEGVRAEVDWTHRNLFPPEGALTLRSVLGTQEQDAGVIFRRSNFHARDRTLTLQFDASHTNFTAYDARTISLSGSIERQSNIFFQKVWTWSVGAELLATDEQDAVVATGAERTRTFLIAALPGQLGYDGSDDLLNPTRGFRLSGRLSPELSLQGSAFGYARTQLDASAYAPVSRTLVLAGRIRLGTIVGAPRDKIAPSRRFYAGGGASVRGYGYQDIGPRDANNNPIGGRSLTEFSLEARVKAFGNFGVVPFFDGGNIYTSAVPRISHLRYGTGLGVRYYSSFGPIRVDIGTPLNPQKGDPRIAVYVSLGQAF